MKNASLHGWLIKARSAFLGWYFHHLYRSLAWSYDLVANTVSLGRWYAWTGVAVQAITRGPVLEIGFGTGHLQVQIAQSGYAAYGIDLSPQMAIRTFNRLRKASQPVRLIRGDAVMLPYPAKSFASIIATFPAPYFFTPEVIAETFRVLEPGGQLIVIPLAWLDGKSLLEMASAGLFQATGQSQPITPQFLDALKQIFAQAGFSAQVDIIEQRSDRVLRVRAIRPE